MSLLDFLDFLSSASTQIWLIWLIYQSTAHMAAAATLANRSAYRGYIALGARVGAAIK
jgi:hypothetical protein